MNENPHSAFYLYGFARSDFVPKGTAATLSETAGLPANTAGAAVLEGCGIAAEHPPFCWRHGDAAAILSVVSREDFCGPAADANLQDLAWVGPRVCRHQAVLEQAMQLAPILPARFGALFSSLEILGQFMERHREAIARFLERVAGQEEWAVKGLLDRARAEEELCRRKLAEEKATLAPLDRGTGVARCAGLGYLPGRASSPGLAYLLEQRLRLQARQELEDRLAGACRALLEELTPLASEACERQVLARETTGVDQEMVLNWAFLAPQPAVAEFQKRVEQVNASQTLPGLTFAVSGPWPPYSFCPALEAGPG